MHTTIEDLGGGRARLTITVPSSEVDAAIAQAYAGFSAKLHIPGFRPGKAPRPLIDTHVGREKVLAEAQDDIVSDSYGRTVSELDLRTIGHPEVGELPLPEPGQDFTYQAEIVLRPELSLSDVEDITVTVPAKKASEREIDAQIEYMRERFATLEPSEEPVGPDDFALISFVGTVDGEPYEGNTVDGYLYELGRGLMPEEFDAALVGTAPGGTAVAEFTIPETSSNEEFVGKKARFEIQVQEVKKKVLPDLDDAFASAAGGFESMAQYREDIREKLDAAKASGHARQVEAAVLAELVRRLEGDVPEEMIDARANSLAREFFESLEQRGLSAEDYLQATGASIEQLEADFREQAARRVREELALEALFRAQGLTISDADVGDTIRELAGGDEAAAAKLREDLVRNGAMPLVREQIMHRKALKWLMDNANVIEEEVVEEEPS